MNSALASWNTSDPTSALQAMTDCCGSRRWAVAMVENRPINSEREVHETADRLWSTASEPDWLEAFACHPRIGDRKPAFTSHRSFAWSKQEQSSTESAAEATLASLAEGNIRYESQFGFTYIVCATGKTPEELLSILERRLGNSRETELLEAAEQQRQIMHIRLRKWLAPMSAITTHVLDVVLGKPGAGIRVTLDQRQNESWVRLNESLTDSDGRCRSLAPDAQPGTFRLNFATGQYLAELGRSTIYPEISITFEFIGDAHYHLPLLLSDNGYTTYRGG